MGNQITEAQRRYAIERAKGVPAAKAYRTAYPNSRASDKTVQAEAWRLEQRVSIKMLIAEITQRATAQAASALSLTKEVVMRELWDNSQKAKCAVPVLDKRGKPTGQYVASIVASNNALIAIGKELGMFRESAKAIDPLDELFSKMTRDEMRQLIEVLEASTAPKSHH